MISMAKANVTFTGDNEYYTPKEFVARFGEFDYDPATTQEKAKEFNLVSFDTIESDGLKTDWTKFNKIWINPPFTKKEEFILKAWETYQKARNEIYILFPLDYMTTKKFHLTKAKGKLFIPNGRVNFERKDVSKGSPAFGSVVMKLQDTWEVEMINIK